MSEHTVLTARERIKEQYRQQFYESLNPYEVAEMDSSDIDEAFNEMWCEVAAEIYTFFEV